METTGHSVRWRFDGDGAMYRLAAEAQRIRLAHLFDPLLAVHTSLVEPLPHQITAVYEAMLPRQPLRFLLADDRAPAGEGDTGRPVPPRRAGGHLWFAWSVERSKRGTSAAKTCWRKRSRKPAGR